MLFDVSSGLEEFIKPTDLCDCNNPIISKRARSLIGSSQTPRDAAKQIFHFVRDDVPYEVHQADERASDTLERGSGFCVTKSNLQVALLRSIGIPARYHHVHLKKEILRGILPDAVIGMLPRKITYHPWCESYIDGKWISCEALFEKDLIQRLLSEAFITHEQVPTIDWDGYEDLVICTPWIVKDEGVTMNMDNVFREAQIELSSLN